jgi:DNA-binding PadR family transcriptional regulator
MGAGERGRTIRTFETLQRLARGGYVTSRVGGDGLVNYRITQQGKDAIFEHD